jgi:drug/metabolite transporter (DMT)-like permease
VISVLIPAWLWALFTIIASAAQTARNAMQRDLIASVGTAGATYVRFLFGMPFALLFLIVERVATGVQVPVPDARAFGWALVGAVMQTVATGLMLTAMQARSFVVTIAYTKTEPVLIAIFSIVFLHETPTPIVALAIVVATAGVLLMSLPRRMPGDAQASGYRPALIGLASGACFGLSATGYRGAVLALSSPSFIMTATTTLVLGLAIQCVMIVAWLSLRDRKLLMSIARAWRPSLLAGFMGALASQFWFLAFAITSATKVRTLALVEVPMAQIVSRRIFKQGMSKPEIAGMALIVVGVILLVNG